MNADNGNMLWRWSPWATPGRGIASIVDLTYNSLEEHSDSPAGENVSLNISGLVRFGSRLDLHPNQADKSTGKNTRYVRFIDGDGHAARVHRDRERLGRGRVDRARGREPLPAQLPEHDGRAEVLGPDTPGQPDVLVRPGGLSRAWSRTRTGTPWSSSSRTPRPARTRAAPRSGCCGSSTRGRPRVRRRLLRQGRGQGRPGARQRAVDQGPLGLVARCSTTTTTAT